MRHWKKILSSLKNPVQQGRRLSIKGKKKTKMLYMLRSNSQWDKEDLSFTEKKSQNIQCEVFVENVFPSWDHIIDSKEKKTDTRVKTQPLTISEDYTGEIKTSKIS